MCSEHGKRLARQLVKHSRNDVWNDCIDDGLAKGEVEEVRPGVYRNVKPKRRRARSK